MGRVFDLVYTNAAGPGGSGYRSLWAGDRLADAERVDAWLRSLRSGRVSGGPGVAVSCFRTAAGLHAVLATVYEGCVLDAFGRQGGIFAHAQLVAVVEEGAPPAFELALWARSRKLGTPSEEQGWLASLLAGCRRSGRLELPAGGPPQPTDLRRLSTLLALFASKSQPRVEIGGEKPEALVSALAITASWLPPRLRLGLRWGVEVRPVRGVELVFRAGRGSRRPEAVPPWVRRLASQIDRRPESLEALRENWDIRSWDDLRLLVGLASASPTGVTG